MYFIVYVSSAVRLFTKDDLLDLLNKSRQANMFQGITGMLLYKDGNFMQLIEGERQSVLNLYAKVSRDPGHRGVLLLLEEEATERHFPQWTMGFRDLTSDEALPPGFTDFLNTPLTGREFAANPAHAQELLLMFKQTM